MGSILGRLVGLATTDIADKYGQLLSSKCKRAAGNCPAMTSWQHSNLYRARPLAWNLHSYSRLRSTCLATVEHVACWPQLLCGMYNAVKHY
jgi:hypothetical protein